MSRARCISCALHFHYYYISSTSAPPQIPGTREAGDPCSRPGSSVKARGLSFPDQDDLPESLTHLEISDLSITASGETEPMNVMHLDEPQ